MTSIETLVDRQLNRIALRQRPLVRQELAAIQKPALRVITISRQRGSGGRTLATHLARTLGFELADRQILDYIAQNTGARQRLIDSLDEKTHSGVDLWVEGILRGRYVDQSEYVQWLVKSIKALGEHGDTVILGRGGNVILGQEGGLHVRVVAPRELRVANLVNYAGLSIDQAREEVREFDAQRMKFHWENFGAQIDDPLDYHMVINTGRMSLDQAEKLILCQWQAMMG